jgi:hypothetical protein
LSIEVANNKMLMFGEGESAGSVHGYHVLSRVAPQFCCCCRPTSAATAAAADEEEEADVLFMLLIWPRMTQKGVGEPSKLLDNAVYVCPLI